MFVVVIFCCNHVAANLIIQLLTLTSRISWIKFCEPKDQYSGGNSFHLQMLSGPWGFSVGPNQNIARLKMQQKFEGGSFANWYLLDNSFLVVKEIRTDFEGCCMFNQRRVDMMGPICVSCQWAGQNRTTGWVWTLLEYDMNLCSLCFRLASTGPSRFKHTVNRVDLTICSCQQRNLQDLLIHQQDCLEGSSSWPTISVSGHSFPHFGFFTVGHTNRVPLGLHHLLLRWETRVNVLTSTEYSCHLMYDELFRLPTSASFPASQRVTLGEL